MNEKKVLVVSEGPPPLGSTMAEGGALRAWGLAKGLAGHGFSVTLAYRSTFALADDADSTPIPKKVRIVCWNSKNIGNLIGEHDVVVMRYAMGEAAEILKHMSNDKILVSDSYIPIAVEVSARRSKHPDEVKNFLRLQHTSAEATRRADYILYASQAQRNYYIGYLSGLNKMNPKTYDELQKRMFEVPYGVDPGEKVSRMQSLPNRPTLLWYGAFYSWFDIESLIDSLMEIKKKHADFKLVIAGAKNPYNQDPGLLAHYEKTVRALGRLGDSVEYVDWTPYNKRFEVYAKGSAIVTFNHLGLENELAWRTRLMDYVLSDRPIITNGGDPLGEDLIARGIAFRADTKNIGTVFESVLKNPPSRSTFQSAAEDYDWQRITKEIAAALKSPSRMTVTQMIYHVSLSSVIPRPLRLIFLSPFYSYRYIRDFGFKKFLKKILKRITKW